MSSEDIEVRAIDELTPLRKARQINLDRNIYGTFAEIGAGQETVAHFFRARGASGSIAKSMSAYDMKFSDAIYGRSSSYVSRERLVQMLDHEYALLDERLHEERGGDTRFFVFANTVATRSKEKGGNGHGWLGVRIQSTPGAPPDELLCHIQMRDPQVANQQKAIGMTGVNLLYAAAFLHNDIDQLVCSIVDDVGRDRIEVDYLELRGPSYEGLNPQEVMLRLVYLNLTDAIAFDKSGTAQAASTLLYNKPLVLYRLGGSPAGPFEVRTLQNGCKCLQRTYPKSGLSCDPNTLFELTTRPATQNNPVSVSETLARVHKLTDTEHARPCLVTRFPQFHKLASFLRRFTHEPLAFVAGPHQLFEIFNASYYTDLDGGLLEAVGRMFTNRVHFACYPMKVEAFVRYLAERNDLSDLGYDALAPEHVIHPADITMPEDRSHLYAHLMANDFIVPIEGIEAR